MKAITLVKSGNNYGQTLYPQKVFLLISLGYLVSLTLQHSYAGSKESYSYPKPTLVSVNSNQLLGIKKEFKRGKSTNYSLITAGMSFILLIISYL
jgi:hypothetical protein